MKYRNNLQKNNVFCHCNINGKKNNTYNYFDRKHISSQWPITVNVMMSFFKDIWELFEAIVTYEIEFVFTFDINILLSPEFDSIIYKLIGTALGKKNYQ